MARHPLALLIAMAATILLAGCWDAVPLERRGIATVAGIDVGTEQSLEYTSLVLAFSKEAKEPIIVVSGEAPTPGTTRSERQLKMSGDLLFGQLQATVIGEALARQGLGSSLDIFMRNPSVSNAPPVVIYRGRVRELLALKTADQKDIGAFLHQLLTKAPDVAEMPEITLSDVYYNVLSQHRRAVIPLLSLRNGSPELEGLGIFRGDRMQATVDGENVGLLALLRGEPIHIVHPFPYSGRDGEYQATLDGTGQRRVAISRDSQGWHFRISISLKGRLSEKALDDGLQDGDKVFAVLEAALVKHIEDQTRQFVRYMQTEIRLDALDLAKYALAKWRPELQDVDWDDIVSHADIQVTVKAKLLDLGETR